MRHVINVVSVGILLGLSLFAIAMLTALYATPWQAATIFAVLCGIFSSVSLYFGGRAETQAVAQKLTQSQTHSRSLEAALAEVQAYAKSLEDLLGQGIARQQELERKSHLQKALIILHLVLVDADEDEPPLFI